jgi:drug/metabolite transporter (DMT)-like permease
MDPRKTAVLALFAAPMLWGGALVAGRVVSAEMPPISAAFVRFVVTTTLLALFLRIRGGKLPKPEKNILPALIAAGMTGVALFNVFLFSALATVSAGRSAVIIAMTPAVVAMISAIIYKEKHQKLFPLALILAFLGAAIVISEGDPPSLFRTPPGKGELFMIGCVFSWAAYSFAGKHVLKSFPPLPAIMYSSFFGALLLAIPAFLEGGLPRVFSASPSAWAGLLYMSIGAAGVAHVFYYYGISKIGPSKSAIFMNLEPISALFFGMVLLGEEITMPLAIGSVLVLSGVSLSVKE